jgi:hypothetical protein
MAVAATDLPAAAAALTGQLSLYLSSTNPGEPMHEINPNRAPDGLQQRRRCSPAD